MNTLSRLSSLLLCGTMLLGGCAKDERSDNGGGGTIPDTGEVREVMMTLKNQLVFPKTPTKAGEASQDTKADTPIANAAENAISTLDVYVFGAKAENEPYTFQQRFAYRANSNDKLPAGATELQLNSSGADDKETTGLMKIKKGLFVKLYCVANDTTLIDPASNKVVKPADFTPITFTEGEDGNPTLATEGVPQETAFTTWHTRLLTAAVKTDTLATPLAMAGALTTPVDLTTFDNSARVQINFKLTRLAARFDISNKAEDSRFTIESVSMGNGRRASGLFPIRVYGDLPKAQPDQLISYPAHVFAGKDANKGLCTGAFYTYPSPREDKAFIILKGKYKVNETEMKDVSYQVPFTQEGPDGGATWFDIANNHRYTIAITKADLYKLNANIQVADWADNGDINYTPDNKPGEISVTIPEAYKADTKYNEAANTINMSLVDKSYFTLSTTSNSALGVSKIYAGGIAGKLFDWMEISDPTTTLGANGTTNYTYTVSLKAGYITGRYPRVTVRFHSLTDGSENIIYIDALAVPKPIETPQPPKAPNGTSANPNSFDPQLLEASVYRITGSRAQVKMNCPDDIVLKSKPDWLNVSKVSQSGAETVYELVLNDRDVVVNNNRGTIVFHNQKSEKLGINIDVALLEAPVSPSYETIGTDNNYTGGTSGTPDDVEIAIKKNNSATVISQSMDGVSVKIDYLEGSPEWLLCDGAATVKATQAALTATPPAATKATGDSLSLKNTNSLAGVKQNIKFSPIESKLSGAKKATVTLKNTIGGKDFTFTITPNMQPATALKGKEASVPLQDALAADKKTITLYQLPGDNAAKSQMQIAVTSLGGSALTFEGSDATVSPAENTSNEANYLLKPTLASGKNEATLTLHAKNNTDKTKMTDYAVTVLRSDLTGEKEASLTAVKDQTVTFKASSYEGFSIDKAAIAWQPVGESGGSQWFDIPTTDFEAGKEKLITLKAVSTTTTAQVRPAVITLKNKIVNGGDLKVTVTPVYSVPSIKTVGDADPKQNTLNANLTASTLKMYKVKDSKITLMATAIGGSKISDIKGVVVTGGDTYNTENTYVVTMQKEATEGSFKIINKSDPTKVHTVTVEPLSTTITANNISSLSVTPSTTQNSSAYSPEGFKASVTGWGSGGAWFDLPTTDFAKGNVNVGAKVKSVISNIGIKTATVTLVNNIRGGENKTFTVNPVLAVPTTAFISRVPTQNTYVNNAAEMKLYKVSGSKVVINATSFGGNKVIAQTNVSVAGAGGNNNTNSYTVTLNSSNSSGSFTLANNSDPSKTKVIQVTALNTDIAATNPSNSNLSLTPSTTATVTTSSPEGFTTSTNWNGGSAWFDLPSSFSKGSASIKLTVKANLTNLDIRKATVTLKNNITGGVGRTFTVTPAPGVPTVKRVSALPTGNKPTGNNSTLTASTPLTLYKLATTSNYVLSATCYGGTKAVASGSGFTVSPSNALTTNTTKTYTLTPTTTSGSGTITIYNSDNSKSVAIPVTVKNGVMSVNSSNLTLMPYNKSTTFNLTSSEGYKSYSVGWNSGNQWFTLPATASGGTNKSITVSSNSVRNKQNNAVVTLVNSIEGAPNLTFNVNAATTTTPTVYSYNSASPAQNSGSGTNITLYAVNNSSIRVVVNSTGGSFVYSKDAGLNVTGGGTSTSNTYTVTSSANTPGTYSFVIANYAVDTKQLKFTVTKKADAITASNRTIAAATSGTSNINVASELGCTASIFFASGTTPWFTCTASLDAGSKILQITQLAGNSDIIMKPATIRLTSKGSGGATKDIIITPTFAAPTLSAASGKDDDFYLNTTNKITFTASAAGSLGTPISSDTRIATVSRSNNTYTVTPIKFGQCTISVPNGSDNTKKSTYTVTISGKNSPAGSSFPVYKIGQYYVTAEDGKNTDITIFDAQSYCSGDNWSIGYKDQWSSIFNTIKSNSLGEVLQLRNGASYFTNKGTSSTAPYFIYNVGGNANYKVGLINKAALVRCVSTSR